MKINTIYYKPNITIIFVFTVSTKNKRNNMYNILNIEFWKIKNFKFLILNKFFNNIGTYEKKWDDADIIGCDCDGDGDSRSRVHRRQGLVNNRSITSLNHRQHTNIINSTQIINFIY